MSKDFRDDYVALNLSHISYVMLIATCLACNDPVTADLASRNLKENAQFIKDLGKLVPYAVVRDLSDLTDLNANAIQQAQEIYASVWQ